MTDKGDDMTNDGWSSKPVYNADFYNGDVTLDQIKNLKQEGSNLIDDDHKLYFQCDGCQKLLDPDTKSFKTLHDKTKEAGWKIKWNVNGLGYKVYCVKCEGSVE